MAERRSDRLQKHNEDDDSGEHSRGDWVKSWSCRRGYPAGEIGALHVCGVFEMPKADEDEIQIGTDVYSTGEGITKSADNGKTSDEKVVYPLVGYTIEAAAASDTKVKVKLVG